MGVTGLWKEIEEAHSFTSWGRLADSHFERNDNGARGFRVGIDVALWLFHAAKMDTPQADAQGNLVQPGL